MYLFLMAAADVQHGHRTVRGTVPCWGDELWCARWGQGLHGTGWLALRHAWWRGVDYTGCGTDGLLGGEGTGQVLFDLLPLRLAYVVVGGVLQMGLYLSRKNMKCHHRRRSKTEIVQTDFSKIYQLRQIILQFKKWYIGLYVWRIHCFPPSSTSLQSERFKT